MPGMAELQIYEKPTCTTCKNLALLLKERGIEFDSIEYHVLGLTEDEVRDLVRKTGGSAADLLRKRDPAYKELGFDTGEHGDDEVIAAMVTNPALLQRPVVVRGERAVLARPVERALELFD
jgi:arsenate reductase